MKPHCTPKDRTSKFWHNPRQIAKYINSHQKESDLSIHQTLNKPKNPNGVTAKMEQNKARTSLRKHRSEKEKPRRHPRRSTHKQDCISKPKTNPLPELTPTKQPSNQRLRAPKCSSPSRIGKGF
jgi:hypothetical protein